MGPTGEEFKIQERRKKMKKLNDNWKNTSISIGTMVLEDIVHTLESTFPDEDIAGKLYDLTYGFWSTDKGEKEKTAILNEDIFDFLNGIAPAGFYFGAHPDDDSDFGFWKQPDCDNCIRPECNGDGHLNRSLALLNPDWPRYPNCAL